MTGNNRTTKRLAASVALAVATAAITVTNALAGGTGSRAFTTDTLSSARAAATPASFFSDVLNSARVGRIQRETAARALPSNFITDTLDTAWGERRQPQPTTPAGFGWATFGIGAGIGSLFALGALAARNRSVRRLAGV